MPRSVQTRSFNDLHAMLVSLIGRLESSTFGYPPCSVDVAHELALLRHQGSTMDRIERDLPQQWYSFYRSKTFSSVQMDLI